MCPKMHLSPGHCEDITNRFARWAKQCQQPQLSLICQHTWNSYLTIGEYDHCFSGISDSPQFLLSTANCVICRRCGPRRSSHVPSRGDGGKYHRSSARSGGPSSRVCDRCQYPANEIQQCTQQRQYNIYFWGHSRCIGQEMDG